MKLALRKRFTNLQTLVFMSLSILILDACAEPGDFKTPTEAANGVVENEAAGDPIEVRFGLSEFAIDAQQTTFQTGVPYRFVLQNEGALAHDFRITELGEAQTMVNMHVPGESHVHGTELMLVDEPDLQAGAENVQEITFMRPGEFEIACHVAGHLQAGMYIPIIVEGDVLATPTPIDPASITYDAEAMPDLPCHAMGVTIMGDCTEADVERITAEILGTSSEALSGDDGHGHDEAEAEDHAHDDASMSASMPMMSDDARAAMHEMMAGMVASGAMPEDMLARMVAAMEPASGEGAMGRRIVFDLSNRQDEACQIIEPNTIAGACTPEDIARLVGEIMASMESSTSGSIEIGEEGAGEGEESDDHGHEEGTEDDHSHDESSGG